MALEDIDPSEKRIMHDLFSLVDADHSGGITADEMRQARCDSRRPSMAASGLRVSVNSESSGPGLDGPVCMRQYGHPSRLVVLRRPSF